MSKQTFVKLFVCEAEESGSRKLAPVILLIFDSLWPDVIVESGIKMLRRQLRRG